jgi:hypothetical protein
VFGPDGRVVIALAIPYFSETLPGNLIAEHARLLVHEAGAVTREIRGETVDAAGAPGTAGAECAS